MTDPNVQTTPEGETVVLEPGDEGYVDPNAEPNVMAPEPHAEGATLDPALPVQQAGEGEVPPQDLSLQSAEGQDNSEAIVMNRGLIVESTSPTDIVPNTPQIRPFPSEAIEEDPPVLREAEGLATVEATDAANTQQDEGRVTVLNAVEARRAEL